MKEAALEFQAITGSAPTILWTDHRNNTKMSLLPPEACGEKILRWWSEIHRTGAEPRFTAGKVNHFADGLSRNPNDRDKTLAERAQAFSDPDYLEKAFSNDEYEDVQPADYLDQLDDVYEARNVWYQSILLQCLDPDDSGYCFQGDEVIPVYRLLFIPSWETKLPPLSEVFRSVREGQDVAFRIIEAEHPF